MSKQKSLSELEVERAACRSGEKIHSEYYGEDSDYTRNGGVVCSEILLPAHAPSEYADRETLWNAVEKVERGKKARLACSFCIALQNEFSTKENTALARQFLLEQFVSVAWSWTLPRSSDCGEKLSYNATNHYKTEGAFFACSLHWKHKEKCGAHFIRESGWNYLVLRHPYSIRTGAMSSSKSYPPACIPAEKIL